MVGEYSLGERKREDVKREVARRCCCEGVGVDHVGRLSSSSCCEMLLEPYRDRHKRRKGS
jgi:hypothetical protein